MSFEYLLLLPLVMLTLNTLNNAFWGPFLYKFNKSESNLKVSILIAAKNEKHRIAKCLETISNQDFKNYEIIVLDDESSDGTSDFIKSNFPSVKIVNGSPRPIAWNGKNWACNQLSEIASGEVLIFTDADDEYSKSIISKTIWAIEHYELDLLSAFPRLENKSIEEKLFVPIVDIILYSFLPLWKTMKSKDSAFSGANGQWLAVKRSTYLEIDGHRSVKESLVEDIEIALKIKKAGYKILTVAGTNEIKTRMYDSTSSIIKGFSKNIPQMLGNSAIGNIFFLMCFILTIVPLFLAKTSLIAFVLISLWLGILSLIYKQNPFIQILAYPITVLFIIIEYFFALRTQSKKKVIWK